MKKKILTIGAIAIVTLSSVFLTDSVYAEQSLQEVKDERQGIKSQLSKAEAEIADVLFEIKEINEELEQVIATLKENQTQMDKAEQEVDKLAEEITLIEIEIEKRNDILKDRISSLQENGGNIKYLEVFLGAKDFAEFISRLSAVTTITNADADLIAQQESDKAIVEEKLAEQEELLSELKAMETLILEQKETVEAGKKELQQKEDELKSKKSKLQSKDSNLATLEKEIRAEMASSVAVPAPAVVGSSNDNSSKGSNKTTNNVSQVSGGGALGWPTSGGYISSQMGMRWGSMHKGIDIARTDRSTSPPIFAAEGGTVVSAGTMNGYGNTVVISHGNGMQTLYAHMASLNVSSGQTVSKGTQIGIMGNTGDSQGIHLHFEVHVNGSIQNPVGYLK